MVESADDAEAHSPTGACPPICQHRVFSHELVRATGWRFESSLPHQRHSTRKDGLSFTFGLSLLPLPGEPGGAAAVRRCRATRTHSLRRSHFVSARCDAVDSDCPRNCPCGESWVNMSESKSSPSTRVPITPGSRAVCVHAVGGMSGGALRVSMQHDSAVDAGHRECARSMAITSAFRALASGVLCEMLRGMALVEALGLRTKKPRRDLSDVMNSVSLGD
jgi:hypothetical protein